MPQEPSEAWVKLFAAVCVVMALGCLYHAIKVGISEFRNTKPGDPWLMRISAALSQVGFLVLFVVGYWLLESYAHEHAPYYVYSKFPGSLARFDWKAIGLGAAQTELACPVFVGKLLKDLPNIPFSVLLLEASITYVAMWTALMLRAPYYLVPVVAGLLALDVDALLDPVVAIAYDCEGKVLSEGHGLGFWHWVRPTGADDYMGSWFGVPLFNYAAWWAAPVTLISVVMMIQYWRGRFWRRVRGRPLVESAPEGRQAAGFAAAIATILAAFVFLLLFKDDYPVPVWVRWSALGVVVVGSAAWIVAKARGFESHGVPDPALMRPPMVFLGLATAALLLEGVFLDLPGLMLVGVLTLLVGFLLVCWPYQQAVCGFAQRVIHLDRLVRLRYLGFTSMLVLLGAFAVALVRDTMVIEIVTKTVTVTVTSVEIVRELSRWQIGGLLLVGAAFHLYAYVLKDVIVFQRDGAKRFSTKHPLAREDISIGTALAVALVQAPAALLLALLLHADVLAYLVLVTGFVLMTAYCLWGERGRPMTTDVVQALAWGTLVLFGALAAMPDGGTNKWFLVMSIAVFGIGFMFLVNAIHRGLHDLENESARDVPTTARALGARWSEEEGSALSSHRLQVVAFGLHTAMFALPAWLLFADVLDLGSIRPQGLLIVRVVLVLAFLISTFVLARVVRLREPRRRGWIRRHVLIAALPPVVGFLPFLDLSSAMVLLVCFFTPLLAIEAAIRAILRVTHREIAEQVTDPPGEQLLPETEPPAGVEPFALERQKGRRA